MKEVTKNPIKGTLRLKNPILINGNEITEVTYDSNEIDGILLRQLSHEGRRQQAGKIFLSPRRLNLILVSTFTSASLPLWP